MAAGAPTLMAAHARRPREEVTETEPSADDDSAPDVPLEEMFPEPEPGRVRIGPDIISPESLQTLSDLAAEIHLKGSLTPRRVAHMMNEIKEEQSLSKSDLGAIDGFVREMRAWHKELHGRYRDSDYQDRKVNEQLMKVHQFLHQWDGAKERYRIQARTNELGRLAQGSPAFSPTTSAFFAFAQISQRDMKETLDIMDGLGKADSPNVARGNASRTLTRDEIWQAKLQLLDEATKAAKAGKPTEIDVQYYELTSQTMLSRLVDAARAGNKLRVNLDPGRMLPDRGDGSINASEIAKKLQSAYRLFDSAEEGADIGFTFFPVQREIGEINLMHQKLFRVGDRVILGGMNANSASGENVDAAVLLEGPAAQRLVGVFERDSRLSAGAKLKEIYNPEHTAMISAGGMYVGPSALMALLLNGAGKEYRGVDAPRLPHTPESLEKLADAAGTRMDLVLDFTDENGDGQLDAQDLEKFMADGDAPSNVLPLKRDGGRMLAHQLKEVIQKMTDDDNTARALDISSPEAAAHGKEALCIGDSPNQRTAILLHAIANAEKFMYIPSFVMTRVVARAVAARYQELKAQGKELDVRVILDPGIYPDGGSPNEAGYLALEDAGIPVRWAMLTRTDLHHDRKIHAKEIVTEKMAFLGSTNMSTKGLKSNWELSGVIEFDPADAASVEQRDHLVKDFMETWDNESIRIDTRTVSESRLQDVHTPDHEARVEECRHSVTMAVLRVLNNYERDSAKVVGQLIQDHPELEAEIKSRMDSGMTRGYATLRTLEEKLGRPALHEALARIDSAKSLQEMAAGRYPFGE
jgi:phosphatidylserine/phosphatidylglycerophosphate/cardiolipin synthase-like enzyme